MKICKTYIIKQLYWLYFILVDPTFVEGLKTENLIYALVHGESDSLQKA
jgi:hypothetical protein